MSWKGLCFQGFARAALARGERVPVQVQRTPDTSAPAGPPAPLPARGGCLPGAGQPPGHPGRDVTRVASPPGAEEAAANPTAARCTPAAARPGPLPAPGPPRLRPRPRRHRTAPPPRPPSVPPGPASRQYRDKRSPPGTDPRIQNGGACSPRRRPLHISVRQAAPQAGGLGPPSVRLFLPPGGSGRRRPSRRGRRARGPPGHGQAKPAPHRSH